MNRVEKRRSQAENPVREVLASVLKEGGFTRRSNSWYWSGDETILVVNLQKSAFGEQYYINLAVWLKRLGDVQFPRENHCHLRLRVDSLSDEGAGTWDKELLNLKNESIAPDVRKERIAGLVRSAVLPFFEACKSFNGIVRLNDEGRLKYAAILAPLFHLLSTR